MIEGVATGTNPGQENPQAAQNEVEPTDQAQADAIEGKVSPVDATELPDQSVDNEKTPSQGAAGQGTEEESMETIVDVMG